MVASNALAGYFRSGLPYNRYGHGPRPLVVFQGLLFENKPSGTIDPLRVYKFLEEEYTVYVVLRKPGLPDGYTMKGMSDDYAAMIEEEFGGPIDVIGVSTGGSIVQHFAADHPNLVRRLVIHSSAYVLSDAAKDLQMSIAGQARQGRWLDAYSVMLGPMLGQSGIPKFLLKPVTWFSSLMAGLMMGIPRDLSDLVITIEAEDKHDFKNRLSQIKVPTLVIAGSEDPFYTEKLFRDTAEGIPNARLILYPGMGHPASGEQFQRDVLAFLKD